MRTAIPTAIAVLALITLAQPLPSTPARAQGAVAAATGVTTAGETALWNSVRDSRDPDDVQAYLDAYPQGAYASLARERLATLFDSATPAPATAGPNAVTAAPATTTLPQPARPTVQQAVAGPAPEHACDRLAEVPHGAMGNASPAFTPDGVPDDKVDLARARTACNAAMAEWPNEPRFVAYVARILDQSNEVAASKPLYRRAADMGNPFAAYVVGGDYLFGRDGTPVDGVVAIRYLRKAAEGGVAYALVPLADWYLDGKNGLRKDEREAARLYRKAADQRDAGGQAGLAYMIQHQRGGLSRDDREALRLYRVAADQGNAMAQHQLGAAYAMGELGLVRDDSQALRLFRLAAEQKLSEAQLWLGTMYESGRGGIAADKMKAAAFYKLAADQGLAPAQAALAAYYENGTGGLPRDHREALRLYRLASEQGHVGARAGVQRLAQEVGLDAAAPTAAPPAPVATQNPVPPAPAIAGPSQAPAQTSAGPAPATECDRVAEPPRGAMSTSAPRHTKAGVSDSQVMVLDIRKACGEARNQYPDETRFIAYYARSFEATSRWPETIEGYRVAAERGNAFAQLKLSRAYLQGIWILKQDDAKGMRLLRDAAMQGATSAIVDIADLELAGTNGVPVDAAEAAKLYELAAKRDDARGRVGLGLMLMTGDGGLEMNPPKAFELLRLAAGQDEPTAQHWLGVIYEHGWHEHGLTVAKNEQAAERLFRLAADAGLKNSQYRLGRMYLEGRGGLPMDVESARELFEMAAGQGSPEAQSALDALPPTTTAPDPQRPPR